jgi:hypothetical protein
VKEKLLRWALKMIGLRCTIEHVSGEDNVWADIVSRWGRASPSSVNVVSVKRVTTRSEVNVSLLRPLQDPDFVWEPRFV